MLARARASVSNVLTMFWTGFAMPIVLSAPVSLFDMLHIFQSLSCVGNKDVRDNPVSETPLTGKLVSSRQSS